MVGDVADIDLCTIGTDLAGAVDGVQEGQSGMDVVGSAADLADHRCRVVGVGGLAEDLSLALDKGVGCDDEQVAGGVLD